MPASAREDRRPLLHRIDRLAAGAFSFLALLLGVYWVHQVLRGDEYARQAENNRQRSVPISASRGFILDRNGKLLAENEPSFTLLLYRRETQDVDGSLRFVVEPPRTRRWTTFAAASSARGRATTSSRSSSTTT